jgi:hypothetical protein
MRTSSKWRWSRPAVVWLALCSCLMGGDLAQLIFAPRESVFAGEQVLLWALLRGERRAWPDWQYRWELLPGDGVLLNATTDMLSFEKNIEDSRNLCCATDVALAAGQGSGTLELRLQLSNAAGQTLTQTKILNVWADVPPSSRAELEERRLDAIHRALHWLVQAQTAQGCWCPFFLDDSQSIYQRTAATACALWAFGNCGYGLRRQHNNPYMDVVQEGIEYLLLESDVLPLTPVAGRDCDRNGNGIARVLGRRSVFENYTQPMAIAGIIASALPDGYIVRDGRQQLLRDEINDACDFTIWQLFSNSAGLWQYSLHGVEGGGDLSLAGWNYLGMDAMAAWDIPVLPEAFLHCRNLLAEVYRPAQGRFVYRPGEESMTLPLDASGIFGVYVIAQASSEAAYCYYEKLELTAGEIITRALAALGDNIGKSAVIGNAYYYWLLAKTLQKMQINHLFIDGQWRDWRRHLSLDEGDWPGLWQQILSLQKASGQWQFESEHFRHSYYSDELETALMLMTLSDQLVKPMPPLNNAALKLSIPEQMEGALCCDDFVRQKDDDADVVFLHHAFNVDDLVGDGSTLYHHFELPECQQDELLALQNDLMLSYVDRWGREQTRQGGTLSINRMKSASEPEESEEPEEPDPEPDPDPAPDPDPDPEEPDPDPDPDPAREPDPDPESEEPEEPVPELEPDPEPEDPDPNPEPDPESEEPEESEETRVPSEVEPPSSSEEIPGTEEEENAVVLDRPIYWRGASGRLVSASSLPESSEERASDAQKPTGAVPLLSSMPRQSSELPARCLPSWVQIESRVAALLGELRSGALAFDETMAQEAASDQGTIDRVCRQNDPAASPGETLNVNMGGELHGSRGSSVLNILATAEDFSPAMGAFVPEAEQALIRLSVFDADSGVTSELFELSEEQAAAHPMHLHVIANKGISGENEHEFSVLVDSLHDSDSVALSLPWPSLLRPYIIAAQGYIVLGGFGHDLSSSLRWQAAEVRPKTALIGRENMENTELILDYARRWLKLAEKATIHYGSCRIHSPAQLPAALLLVIGDVELNITGHVQCSILATGRIRVRGHQAFFRPYVDNVLFFSEKGIELGGSDNGFRGDIAVPVARLRIQGRRQRFASGGLWGRHVLIRGENHAFISDDAANDKTND